MTYDSLIINSPYPRQKLASYIKILKDNDVTTVEMLLELSEQDYVGMGLGLALVRTMLRKAKEIVTSSAGQP